ncbi:MAG: hypothetical protein AAF493_21520 [Pseudomonadota bacterium]
MNRSEWHSRLIFWGLLGLAMLTSYGSVWSRGGYADDFVFVAHVLSEGVWETILEWHRQFNSRLTQGVIIPSLIGLFAGKHPLDFNWSAYHAIGVLCLLLTSAGLYRLMRQFQCPLWIAGVGTVVFALNPIKTSAAFWPATIVGYLIPAAVTVWIASWHLSRVQRDRESGWVLVLVVAGLLVAALSLEQFFLLGLIWFAVRYAFSTKSHGSLIRSVVATVIYVVGFVAGTALGSTGERAARFASIEMQELPVRALSVITDSTLALFGYAPRILLDDYFRVGVVQAVMQFEFVLGGAAAVGVAVVIAGQRGGSQETPISALGLWLVVVGAVIWGATLSIFTLLDYGMPDRVFFVPSLGVALLIAGMFAVVDGGCRSRAVTTGSIAMLGIALVFFVLVNQFDQTRAARQWAIQEDVIRAVADEGGELPSASRMTLFNLPATFGPVPGMRDRFSLGGIVDWTYPARRLRASTLTDLSEIFALSDPKPLERLDKRTNDVVLLWTHKGVRRVEQITNATVSSGPTGQSTTRIALEEFIPSGGARYRDQVPLHLTVVRVLHSKAFNFAIISLQISGAPERLRGKKLIVHAHVQAGGIRPQDLTISKANGFVSTANGFAKTLLLDGVSSVSTVSFSLSGTQLDEVEHSQSNLPSGLPTLQYR